MYFWYMQVQVDIAFDELVKIVKALPAEQLNKLKTVINSKGVVQQSSLEDLLLHGPVATRKQMEIIENNRKAINQWRIKL